MEIQKIDNILKCMCGIYAGIIIGKQVCRIFEKIPYELRLYKINYSTSYYCFTICDKIIMISSICIGYKYAWNIALYTSIKINSIFCL